MKDNALRAMVRPVIPAGRQHDAIRAVKNCVLNAIGEYPDEDIIVEFEVCVFESLILGECSHRDIITLSLDELKTTQRIRDFKVVQELGNSWLGQDRKKVYQSDVWVITIKSATKE
jgi:hypothetical protein